MDSDWSPLWLGLRAAGLSTAIALALGPWLAYWLLRRPAMAGLAGLPLSVATPLMAAYGLLASAFLWPVGGLVALAFSLPYLMRSSAAAFGRLNPDYLNAARGLGASEWRVFQRVAGPLARGPILSAAAFAFACVATDYTVLVMLGRALRMAGSGRPAVLAAPLIAAGAIALAVHYLGSRLDGRRNHA